MRRLIKLGCRGRKQPLPFQLRWRILARLGRRDHPETGDGSACRLGGHAKGVGGYRACFKVHFHDRCRTAVEGQLMRRSSSAIGLRDRDRCCHYADASSGKRIASFWYPNGGRAEPVAAQPAEAAENDTVRPGA